MKRQLFGLVVLLQAADLERAGRPVGDAGRRGPGRGHRGQAGHPVLVGGPADVGAVGPGPRPRGVLTTRSTLPSRIRATASTPSPLGRTRPPGSAAGILFPAHGRLDLGHHVCRPALRPASKYAAVPAVAGNREAQLDEPAGHRHARCLVPVGEREEDRASRRELVAGRGLALGEGQPEAAVDAHHLAGGAHLGPEQGVRVGEAGEREHRLLDADVAAGHRRAQEALGAELLEGGAGHHPGGHLGQRHAGGFGHERHGPAGPRVGLDHEHLRSPPPRPGAARRCLTANWTLSGPITSRAAAMARV